MYLCSVMSNKSIVKLLFDRTFAFVGLIALSPLLLFVWLLIRLKMSGGPAIFTQQRVGRDGKLFTMHKFRSMMVNHGGSSISVAGEARITPLGAVMRRYKLDELPELWDVLRGKMSFVGPRPDVPGYADKLEGDDRRMLLLKPGITGPASLKYRDEELLLAEVAHKIEHEGMAIAPDGRQITTVEEYNNNVIFPDKVKLNLYYLDHYTFIDDIKMIFCTVTGRKLFYGGEWI